MFANNNEVQHIFQGLFSALPFGTAEIDLRVLHFEDSLCRVRIFCLEFDLLDVETVVTLQVGNNVDGIKIFVERELIRTNLCPVTCFPLDVFVVNSDTSRAGCICAGSADVSCGIDRHRGDMIGVIQPDATLAFV